MRDLRGQTLYFIVTDRFCDGDPSNDTGKDSAAYDATRSQWFLYWGGDLLGVLKQLDYLQGMGISALWLTPVFDQVDALVQMAVPMAGYHGYWAKDFKRIDEHLVEDPDHVRLFARSDTLFDQLVAELHQRGMALALDVVCNHSNPHDVPGSRGELYDDGRLIASYDDDRQGWYHHLGEVTDWNNLDEVQTKSFAGLSDFNHDSPAFRAYIKAAICQWLDKGVDALRVDTVKHMPLWFWQEFCAAMREHKPDLFLFGEWFLGGAYDEHAVAFANHSGMTIIDFALHFAIENALGRDRSLREIADVFAQDHRFASPTELMTFVDNHDLPRFLSVRNDPARLRMAVDLIMVARGIPIIYYGTEQCLHNDSNDGKDPYNRPMMERWDTGTLIYQDIRRLAELRRHNLAVQRGATYTRHLSDDVYVFERVDGGHVCVAALNKGPATRVSLTGLALPSGAHRDLLARLPGSDLVVSDGQATLSLSSDAAAVFACP